MAISTNQKPTIYRNLYENTGPGLTNILFQFEFIYIRYIHFIASLFLVV